MEKHAFFETMDRLGLALTYDDVRLKTGHAAVMPSEVKLTTRFSRNVPLNIPIVSSPMDTVTESRMAIAMAKAGGLGVIHRNLNPKSQANEVGKVKSYLNGLVAKPICVFGDETINMIENRRRQEGWNFHSFPVLDRDGKLIGLLTKNDFDLCDDTQLTASAVMTKGLITAKQGTDLETAYEIMRVQKKKVLPLLDSDGRICGMYVFSDVKRIRAGTFDGYNTDPGGHLRVAAAVGVGEAEVERAAFLAAAGVDALVIDTAHGDTAPVFQTFKLLREKFAGLDIVVGNISEGKSAARLLELGVDGIRVGQGPGSICTTRIVAGIGCPQVTAIYNCAFALDGSVIPICADGGIRFSGDITVAIGSGAHNVMLGRLLAGTDEAPGDLLMIRGAPHKTYRGMGSIGAMADNEAARQRYQQGDVGKDRLVPEGIEGAVPYQGPVANLLHQYVEGLRRGMGYTGSASIEELRKKGDFYRYSPAGMAESHPHDVTQIKDAPNYPGGRKEV